MSHEFESGVFVRQPAWHKLGTVHPDKIYSIPQALELSGLDWTISKRKALFRTANDGVKESDNSYLVVRDKDESVLGMCGAGYEVLQNDQALEFFAPLLHEKDCFISTAGSLKGGKKIFCLAEIENNTADIISGDPIKNYILVANSHDGSIKATVKFVSTRVVCANTLGIALAENGNQMSFKHTKNIRGSIAEAQSMIDVFKLDFSNKVEAYKHLANTELSAEQFRSYLENLFQSELTEDKKLVDYRPANKIMDLYESSPDLQLTGVRGTAWAAFNAVTEYVSHHKSKDTENRMNAIWFGMDGSFINKARELALAIN